ncbi:hypothetical protein BDW75DRAFT_247555 [Aspergillus navahoensis]
MASSLAGKVFTVTGGASGIGAATAKLLAQRSAAAVCIADLEISRFAAITEEIRQINADTRVLTTEVDVSSSYSAVGRRGQPTILEESDETWRKTMSVNLDGAMCCTREQVRTMLPLPLAPRTIVNVSSLASFIHTPDAYAYSASKRACASSSTSVAKDVHSFGIRVNTVSPGATLTPMMNQFFAEEDQEASLKNLNMDLLDLSDIARAVVFLLTEDSAKITGANLPVGLGIP